MSILQRTPRAATTLLALLAGPQRSRGDARAQTEAVPADASVYCPGCQRFAVEATPACGTCGGPLVATASAILSATRAARDAETRVAEVQDTLARVLQAVERAREGAGGRTEQVDDRLGTLAQALERVETLLREGAQTAEARLGAQEARIAEAMTRLADVELSLLDAIARGPREASR